MCFTGRVSATGVLSVNEWMQTWTMEHFEGQIRRLNSCKYGLFLTARSSQAVATSCLSRGGSLPLLKSENANEQQMFPAGRLIKAAIKACGYCLAQSTTIGNKSRG